MIDFIKDADCTKETPVRLGVPDAPIYGKGIKLKPRVDGRTDSEHFKKIYLPELLPLEEYDLIVVLISGGKDSVACYLKLLEFPTKLEYLAYIESLKKGKPQKFKETSFEQLESGVVRITIRKQYNNNAFPDDEKEGEK